MRYVDTGGRDPSEALGTWLQQIVLDDDSVNSLRLQSGFFGAGALGYFIPLMKRLQLTDGVLRLLVGSNNGATARADMRALLAAAGPQRSNQRIGVVKFANAFFHPKVVHISRKDESAAAYVGSANLTPSGVAALHIEAGIIVDTRDGDDVAVLHQVADQVDSWFLKPRDGLHEVKVSADIDRLVELGVLNVPVPSGKSSPTGAKDPSGPQLAQLLKLPKLPDAIGSEPEPKPGVEPAPAVGGPSYLPALALSAVTMWEKTLTLSDAQRKQTGHQRGSITLVRAGLKIDAQTYFRHDLFSSAHWVAGVTKTGEQVEETTIPFSVNFLGSDLGFFDLDVSYAPNRESGQANYTSLLHLGPLASLFSRHDVTNRKLKIGRTTDGVYTLTIDP